MFEIWMRLLGRVAGSILWLRHIHDVARERLRRIAAARDVDPSRLVFAARAPRAEQLGRHRVADLYLDTLPYNGHAAVADALWASLPVLTCKGTTFPGRVGASMLGAIGLPDLVTPGLAAYEALALRLATEPELLADTRRRLEAQRTTATLFDIDRLRRHIEAAYLRMDELRGSGAAPQSFAIEAQSGTKAEPKAGTDAEAKDSTEVEPKAETTVEIKAEPKEEVKAELKAETEAEPKEAIKAEPGADSKAEPKEETNAEPGAESKAEPKEDNKAETKAETK
jgi:hypothetical protein